MQLSNGIKITKVADHSAANTTDVESSGVDMAGFEGVIFMTSFGTAAADNIINAQQSTDNSTFADLLGTAVALAGASDEDQWIDIYRPREQYVRCHVERATSTTVESIWAIQYGARKLPVDNTTSGTIAGEAHVSPAEGTA
jgi:hypothetical protein